MNLSLKQRVNFQNKIFSWWEVHKRDLPWRQTRDPYSILVSEMMLQQTQVLRVIPKYAELVEAYPTIKDLAQASAANVLRIWRGMGYNRRALYLHRAAKMIVETYHGVFPVSECLLSKLPGVGTYTARAILVFAFEKNIAMVDTNIRQIITHFFFKARPQKEKVIQEIADQLLPKGKSWAWHQALMDYGALALQSRTKSRDLNKKAIPFRESSRFYRGRIVDALRINHMRTNDLISSLVKSYGKRPVYYEALIDELEQDGLLVKNEGYVSLPE